MKKNYLKQYFNQAEARMKEFHHDNGDDVNDEGFDDDGFDDDGYDDDGYDDDGYDDDGYDDEGYDDEGYDDEGFDDEGFDDEGYENAGGRKRRKRRGKKGRKNRKKLTAQQKAGIAGGAAGAAALGGAGAAAALALRNKKRKKNRKPQQQQKPVGMLPISKSYQLQITNGTALQQTVTIFNSRRNRTAFNFGNPNPLVTITYLRPNFEYVELLADTEQMDLKIGMIRVDCTNTAQLNTPVQWQRRTSDGAICGDSIDSFQNIYQNLPTSVQSPSDFRLTGNTELLYPMLAGISCNMYLFPSHILNTGRLLSGKNAVMGLTDPYLGGIQKVKLLNS